MILEEHNVLFDDLTKNLENHKNLYDFLYSVLIVGEAKSFMAYDPVIELGTMFGRIKKNGGGKVIIANQIFKILISNYFISKDANFKRRSQSSFFMKKIVSMQLMKGTKLR